MSSTFPFSVFDQIADDATAVEPALHVLFDPAASTEARSEAVAALRVDLNATDCAARTILEDPRDHLRLARTLLDAALLEPDAADLISLTMRVVEAAVAVGQDEIASEVARQVLRRRPEDVPLALVCTTVDANRGIFSPDSLGSIAAGEVEPGRRRRVLANLGVHLLAVGRTQEGLEQSRLAAEGARDLMMPDVGIGWGRLQEGRLAWIQRMREVLALDGLGELASQWGLGGPRAIVLLEGLASTSDAASASLLRAESARRLERARAAFAADDPEFVDMLADAAELAERYELPALAARLR